MSLLVATQITAVATAALAAFAIVTAVFAVLAFRKQSAEVGILGKQLEDQRRVNAEQIRVLSLQARELEASLAERKEEAEEQRRAQANRVTAWFALGQPRGTSAGTRPRWGALIRNDSDLPILSTRVFFHFIATDTPASAEWNPIQRGGPPERIRVIPPHSVRFVPIPEQIRTMIDKCDDSVYVVSIEFGDAAGNSWVRDPRGALIPG